MSWYQRFFIIITSFGSIYFMLSLIIIFFLFEQELAIKLFIGTIVIYIIAACIRFFYFKERPRKRRYSSILKKIYASAFPSVHAARGFFSATIITRYYQEPTLGIMLFTIAIVIAFSRYYLRYHHASDVIGGAILGLVTSYLAEALWFISRIPIL